MVVGINEVFDDIVRYLRKNYANVEDINMPYCSLAEETGKTRYYRGQVSFRVGKSVYHRTAIFKADIETGKVFWFQEGKTWTYWF